MLETNMAALPNFRDIDKGVQHEITKHVNSPEEKVLKDIRLREARTNLS